MTPCRCAILTWAHDDRESSPCRGGTCGSQILMSSTRCFMSPRTAANGAPCRSGSATGTRSTRACGGGRRRAFWTDCSSLTRTSPDAHSRGVARSTWDVRHDVDVGPRHGPGFEENGPQAICKLGFSAINIEGKSFIADNQPIRPARSSAHDAPKAADKIRQTRPWRGARSIMDKRPTQATAPATDTASAETILPLSTP